MKRIVLGFLAAPLPAASFQSAVVGAWPKEGKGIFEHPDSMFVAVCLLFYVIELVLAVPVYWGFRKRLPARMAAYGAAGASIVLLPIGAALIIALLKGAISIFAFMYNLMVFGAGGLLGGLVFWRLNKPSAEAKDLHQTFA